MKLRISYTLTLPSEQVRDYAEYARLLGMDHDDPDTRTLLKRLFRDYGRCVEPHEPMGDTSPSTAASTAASIEA